MASIIKLTGACLSVEGRAEGPGDQSRESRPAGPNLVQLLSNRDLMVDVGGSEAQPEPAGATGAESSGDARWTERRGGPRSQL